VGDLNIELTEPPGVETVIAEAYARRPDLLELEHRIAVYEQLVKIARADDKPSFEFRAGYGWASLAAGALDGNTRNWDAGVYMAFPFFDGFKAKGRTAAAESDVAQQKIDAARKRDEVRLQAQTAVDAVREAQSIVSALTGTVEQARRLLTMAEQGYELGVKTQIEVQDAQLNVRTAEGNLARARRDLRVATVNLGWVRGAL
jgi:HAE1 family hydrophobic/amphiphilic exporter-1